MSLVIGILVGTVVGMLTMIIGIGRLMAGELRVYDKESGEDPFVLIALENESTLRKIIDKREYVLLRVRKDHAQ